MTPQPATKTTTAKKPVVVQHDSFAEALAAFQASIPTIEKGATANAGKFKYSYADLETVTKKVLPLLARHGLAWTCSTTLDDGRFVLEYALLHVGGESVRGVYPLPNPNTPPQQMGSAITYAKRYALLMVTGVAPGGEDDDAVAAQRQQQPQPQVWQAPHPQTQPHPQPQPQQQQPQPRLVTPDTLGHIEWAREQLGIEPATVVATAQYLGYKGDNLARMTVEEGAKVLQYLTDRMQEQPANAVEEPEGASD